MSIGGSLSASHSNSKSKTTQDNTIDPTSLGLWHQGFDPALTAIGSMSNAPYGGPLGAGLDGQQTQAAGMAQANAGAGQGAVNGAIAGATKAGAYSPDQVHSGQLAGMDYGQYMDPYLQSVLGSTLDSIDLQRQRSLVGNAQAAGPGAWGGSRHGVADSLTNEAALRESSSAANNIMSQGFNNAQQAGQFDINNRLGADQFNVNSGMQNAQLGLSAANSLNQFGQTQNQLGANDANLINQFGQQAQATQQNQNTQAYQEWLRQMGIPAEQAGLYLQAAGQVPIVVDSKGTGKNSSTGFGATVSASYGGKG